MRTYHIAVLVDVRPEILARQHALDGCLRVDWEQYRVRSAYTLTVNRPARSLLTEHERVGRTFGVIESADDLPEPHAARVAEFGLEFGERVVAIRSAMIVSDSPR